jgi:hypothetical protein
LGKGVHFPGIFLTDKKGWRRKMKILQRGEVEMELKKLGDVKKKKLKVMGEVERGREVKIAD